LTFPIYTKDYFAIGKSTDNTIVFKFPYNPNVITDIKAIEGRKYNLKSTNWEIPVNINTFKGIRNLIIYYKFNFDSRVSELIKNADLEKKELENTFLFNEKLSSSTEPVSLQSIDGLKLKLKQFQLAGVEYIVKNKRLIIGDEMGLGKTIESLAATRLLNSFPALVICPNSLKYNWINECNKWLNDIIYRLFLTDETFTANDLMSNHISVVSYNTAIKHKAILAKVNWKTIIIDESQAIKNSKSQRSKIIKSLTKKPERVHLLTGTPILNRPSELIHQLNVLHKLDLFGGWSFFVERYCNATITPYGVDISGASNLHELHKKLRTYGYLRRNKKDVLKELPDKQRIIVELDIDNRREYNMAAKNVLKYLSENVKKNIPANLQTEKEIREYVKTQRREVISKAIQAESLVQLTKLRSLAAQGKLNSVIEWVSDFLESGEKLVLFGMHTEFITKLANHFKCNLIYGGTDTKVRQEYIDDFQNNEKTKLLILNTAIGNAGFTLTAANNMAFIELDWNPGIHLQCEDRLHRIGQVNKVNCFYLLANKTIDLKMYNVLLEKLEIINAVNSGTEENMESNSGSPDSVLESLIVNMLQEIKE
jgi:SWI/SNF-related matrix-associated actin-dependent regulator 1 of chromatin subfamily A